MSTTLQRAVTTLPLANYDPQTRMEDTDYDPFAALAVYKGITQHAATKGAPNLRAQHCLALYGRRPAKALALFSADKALVTYPHNLTVGIQPLLGFPCGIFVHGTDDGLASQKDIVSIHAGAALP